MKFASKVMYLIGRIFNIIELVCGIIFIVFGVLNMVGVIGAEDKTAQAALGITYLVIGIIITVIALIVLGLSKKASKALNNNIVENKPHIIMIVIGVLSENVFYILGGIFGLIAEH